MTPEQKIIKKLIDSPEKSRRKLDSIKRSISKEFQIDCPSNVSLLEEYSKMEISDKAVEDVLRIRPVRSLSGVINISILTEPFECPGECIFCPSQDGSPKSYLDNEPAVMRAKLNHYDPKKQIENRLNSLQKTGHPTDKVELRIVGETWSHYRKDYRENFIKQCFDTLNKTESKSLEEAQKLNQTATHRMICLSIETRPDYINKEEIINLRKLGITMVELGVQTVFDDVLKTNKRGHGVTETIKATKMLKDSGFKVCYQIMPNLPGSSLKRDYQMVKKIFKDSGFKPDFLKIYPCMVLKEAPLYSLYQQKKYIAYTEKEITDFIIKIKKELIPYWVRIQRVIRDIPKESVIAGGGSSNLRQKIEQISKKENWRCCCIRCREVKDSYDSEEEMFLFKEKYSASGGQEFVLTFENKERTKLYSLLRLRKPDNPFLDVLKDSMIIREIHTYGKQIQIKESSSLSVQHTGLGKKLIKEAEKIAKNKKIAVISGVGAREYWEKNGYILDETYMVKKTGY